MKTFLLIGVSFAAAGCSGAPGLHKLDIEHLKVRVDVPSTAHDVDFIHETDGDGSAKEGKLSRVDITVPKLRMCQISIYPKGEDLTYEKRIASAALKLFGIERELTQWHRKEKTSDGWVLDYEVKENGKSMRVVTQRRTVGGKTFTCESGRITVDEEAEQCAEYVAHACESMEPSKG